MLGILIALLVFAAVWAGNRVMNTINEPDAQTEMLRPSLPGLLHTKARRELAQSCPSSNLAFSHQS